MSTLSMIGLVKQNILIITLKLNKGKDIDDYLYLV